MTKRIAAAVVGMLLLAGCGGEDPERADLESSVSDYSEAFFAGEGLGAYDLISERCRAEIAQDEYVAKVVTFAGLLGDSRPEMTSFTVDSLEGESATVSYSYDRGDYDQTAQPWVREEGGWRYDNC